jgi:hypothetical protein
MCPCSSVHFSSQRRRNARSAPEHASSAFLATWNSAVADLVGAALLLVPKVADDGPLRDAYLGCDLSDRLAVLD